MIHSIKRISKRTLSVVLALIMIVSTMLVGMVTANAMTVSAAHIYFDNTTAQWGSVYLVIGHDSYSSVYQMSKLTGTNLYYLNNSSWSGATYLAFISNNWDSGNWGPSNLSNATYYTSSQSYDINSNNTYIAKPTSKQSKNTASGLTYYSTGYTAANNRTIKLGTMIDGKSSSTSVATLNINSYSLNGNGSVKNSTATGSTTASFTGAPGATTKLSYSGLSSDYKFVGWVNSSGTTVSTSSTYTFSADSTTNTYYANFEKSLYSVSAVAKYQSFNFDTNSYNAVADASSSIGTATAEPTSITPGSGDSSTLTAAVVDSSYTFAGWYDNSSCTGDPVETDLSFSVTPDSSVTYYALFKQTYETKTLTVAENADATVTVTYNGTDYAEGSTATIPVGATVTVKITDLATGKTCSKVTAGTVTASGSDNTFTFKMPSSDAEVVATIADKQTATITVSSNDENLGTATASPTSCYVGDTIKLTATAKNGTFTKWTISGANISTSSDATVTITAKSSTVIATAEFSEKTYEVSLLGSHTDTSVDSTISMKATSVPGVYISTSTISKEQNFTIKRLSDNFYATSEATSNAWYFTSIDSIANVNSWNSSVNQYFFYTYNIDNAYVVYDANEDKIYLNTDPDNKKTFNVYAKNGSVRNDEGDFKVTATLQYGSTVVDGDYTATTTTATNNGTTYNAFKKYSIAEDRIITVTTTLNSTYKSAGFYVGAFCVNGKYLAANKMSDGVYTSDAYTLTSAEAINNSFEITPVYYNSNIDANNDYITFYVDAEEVESTWGGTVAVDAYSYINGSTSSDDHLFGTYPGQPMVLQGKYYTIKVPKYRYYLSGTSYVKDTSSPVSGITMTSYHADLVHYAVVENATYGTTPWNNSNNFQTYDYSDFVNIAALEDVQTIMFENKYYDKDDSSSKDNGSVAKESSLGSGIGSLTTVNPWQKFTDYYGTETGILGDVLSESQLADSKKLYVISVGNSNTQNSSYATEGQWATMWYVYKEDGSYLTKGTPADFISTTSSQYTAIVNAGYQYAQTKISFDKEKTSSVSGDAGVRSDGRWYYSKLGLEFNSSVEIEYIEHTDSGDVIHSDTNTNTENTGFIGGTTDGSKATINNVTTATFTTVDTYPTLNVSVANGWVFEGWYIKETADDGTVKYTKIGSTTTVNDFLMNNAYTIVARLEPIAEGDLVLTHTQYTGTNPAAHTGTGIYYLSANVYNSDGTLAKSFAETEGNISISDLTEEQTIDITIRTVCHGANTFWAWYEQDGSNFFEIADEETDYRGESEGTYKFTLKAKNLFDPVSHKLFTSSLNFYSDIIKVSGYCDITYYYFDRFAVNGANQYASYIVRNVELSDTEIKDGYKPSDDTIMANAPEIDTMYVDTKWVLTDSSKVKKDKSIATVYATQPDKDCLVYYPVISEEPTSIQFSYEDTKVNFNELFLDDAGNFFLDAPETIITKDENNEDVVNTFSYWEVYVVDSQGKPTDMLVTKSYENKFMLRIMGDYKIVPVYNVKREQITANISAPVYNREIMGESTNPTDKLYVDFLVAYTSTDVPIFNPKNENYTNEEGYIVECGVIVDRNNGLSLTTEDRESIINAAVSGASNPWDDLEASYIELFAADHTEASNLAFDSQLGDKTKTYYTDANGNEHRLSKYVLDNTMLTNKNRIDKVLVYTNNEANQNYIFTAYSYVIIRDTSGNIIASVISTPDEAQYYNLCYTGNTPYQETATE